MNYDTCVITCAWPKTCLDQAPQWPHFSTDAVIEFQAKVDHVHCGDCGASLSIMLDEAGFESIDDAGVRDGSDWLCVDDAACANRMKEAA